MLHRVTNRLKRTRAEKRFLASGARGLAEHLEPGLWWLPFAHVLVHTRSPRMPRHARSTMVPRLVGWRATVVALARVLVPPLWVWIPRRGRRVPADALSETVAPTQTATVMFLMRPGRSAVFFDRAGRTVTRVAIDRPMPRRVMAIRRALQEYVPMPVFDVSHDRRILREDLVDGLPLHDLASADRIAVFEGLLTYYTALVRHERRSARPATIEVAFDAVASLAQESPLWARLVARRREALAVAASWPCVPCQGDLTAMNLVVSNGETHVIDFEFADVLPFFYDVVLLALSEAFYGRDDLLAGIRPGGRFERLWRELWTSADLPGAPDSLALVLTAVYVLYARRKDRLRPSGGERIVLEGSHGVPELGVAPNTLEVPA